MEMRMGSRPLAIQGQSVLFSRTVCTSRTSGGGGRSDERQALSDISAPTHVRAPLGMVHNVGSPASRLSCDVVSHCDRFKLQVRTFEQQYDQYYNARYHKMYEWVKESALKKWGDDVSLIQLSELMDRRGERVCIIGILLKVMKLHPSVLREVSEDLELIPEPPLERWVSPTDHFSLQEPGESVVLVGGPDVPTHVTGIAVAVIGHEHDNGNKFIVDDFCYPTPCPQKPLVPAGQDIMDPDLNCVASKIVRLVIAGNCMDEGAADREKELEVLVEDDGEDEWNKKERSYTIETLTMIDEYLSRLGKSVPVDVMPGPFDVTSYLMPQQPMHKLLLPKCARMHGRVRCTTNPYSATFGAIQVLGSSGRVIQSVQEMTTIDEAVDILDETMKWRHMIPTSPDTVFSYPFLDDDPFVLEEKPHIYFAGNQKTFNTKLSEGNGQKTRILSIPSFKLTQTCVAVNLRTLACQVIAFNS